MHTSKKGSAQYVCTDDAPGIKEGLTRYLEEAFPGGEGVNLSCRRHTDSNFEDYKKDLRDKTNFGKMKTDFNLLRNFGDPRYRDIVWGAIKEKWCKMGESHIAKRVDEHHVKKNPGWMSGTGPYGCKSHNQQVEISNRFNIKSLLREKKKDQLQAQAPGKEQKKGKKDVLPVPVSFGLPHLKKHIIKLSREAEKKLLQGKGFALTRSYTKSEVTAGEKFSRDVDLVELGEGFIGCKQLHQDVNSATTKKALMDVLESHRKILSGEG